MRPEAVGSISYGADQRAQAAQYLLTKFESPGMLSLDEPAVLVISGREKPTGIITKYDLISAMKKKE